MIVLFILKRSLSILARMLSSYILRRGGTRSKERSLMENYLSGKSKACTMILIGKPTSMDFGRPKSGNSL